MRVSCIRKMSLPRTFTIMQGMHNTFNTSRLTHRSHMQERTPTSLNSTRRAHANPSRVACPLSSDVTTHLCLQQLRYSLHASVGHLLRPVSRYFYISPASHPISILSFPFTHTSLVLPLYILLYIYIYIYISILISMCTQCMSVAFLGLIQPEVSPAGAALLVVL